MKTLTICVWVWVAAGEAHAQAVQRSCRDNPKVPAKMIEQLDNLVPTWNGSGGPQASGVFGCYYPVWSDTLPQGCAYPGGIKQIVKYACSQLSQRRRVEAGRRHVEMPRRRPGLQSCVPTSDGHL